MDGRIMSKKSSNIQKIQRVLLVEEMILKGCNKSYIVRFISEKHNITERQIENYISEASEKIKKDFENTFDKENFKAEIFGRFQDLYRKNYTIEDFRECRNLLKDIREMLGLNEPLKSEQKTELIGKIEHTITGMQIVNSQQIEPTE
jgi:nucleoid DNA-binding protein